MAFGLQGMSGYRPLGDGLVQKAFTTGANGTAGGQKMYDEGIEDFQLARNKQQLDYKQGIFNQVFPWAQGLMGGGGGQTTFSAVGGQNTALPQLPSSFVYSPDMIQQQVNAARAQGDQGTQTQKTQATNDMAARGFSSRSPLHFAMQQAADTAGRTSNADQERQIRFDATGANAKQGLAVGGLANQQWDMFNNSDIARRKLQADSVIANQRNMIGILSSLGLG